MYMDMIKQIEGFKYSSNIKYDLKKDNNIIQYIPTENSLEILRTMFQAITRDTISNKQNARLYMDHTGRANLYNHHISIYIKSTAFSNSLFPFY